VDLNGKETFPLTDFGFDQGLGYQIKNNNDATKTIYSTTRIHTHTHIHYLQLRGGTSTFV